MPWQMEANNSEAKALPYGFTCPSGNPFQIIYWILNPFLFQRETKVVGCGWEDSKGGVILYILARPRATTDTLCSVHKYV